MLCFRSPSHGSGTFIYSIYRHRENLPVEFVVDIMVTMLKSNRDLICKFRFWIKAVFMVKR